MPEPRVTVVVPTLAADSALQECLQSLGAQTRRDFDVVVVDNSAARLARRFEMICAGTRILENDRNVGFGAAVNQGLRASDAPYLAALNDDAAPHPGWLDALIEAIEPRPDVGMCASRVLLAGEGRIDSAGMLLCADGSSRQRGHGEEAARFPHAEEVLLPSGAAALYRRAMLDRIGGFDEDFFLYCEDTDLGLRARWAGWKCLYVPEAVVEHRYSHSAGRASRLKAYYVERNRLYLIAKNLPALALALVPVAALARYAWHVVLLRRNRGAAARFGEGGHGLLRLAWLALRAHAAVVAACPALWRKRRAIRRSALLTSREFRQLMRTYSISPREVAAL